MCEYLNTQGQATTVWRNPSSTLAVDYADPSAATPPDSAGGGGGGGGVAPDARAPPNTGPEQKTPASRLIKCSDHQHANLYHWTTEGSNHCNSKTGELLINSYPAPGTSTKKNKRSKKKKRKVETPATTLDNSSYNVPLDEKPSFPDPLMWEHKHPPVSQCTSAVLLFCRSLYRLWKPTLRTVGQCLFGLAMLFLIAGIALCIWGYLGTAIRQFQIFGPVCIGIGVVVYIIGCILCCRDYPDYELNLKETERQEKARQAMKTLKQKEVIEWIQGEPEVYDEFKELAIQILNTHG